MSALPKQLIKSLQGLPGFNESAFIDAHQQAARIVSIRLNRPKLKSETALSFANDIKEKVSWCPDAFYLQQRPQFVFDPLWHAGAYYVQEASSMFLHEVLKQTTGSNTYKTVLDLCAAPGGKSTLLSSYFSNGLVVANELIKNRVNILYENITKWGCNNVVVTSNEAKNFNRLAGFFDVLVVDAPCSGSGLFRKDADAINEWSEHQVQLCARRQYKILEDAYNCLKKDGLLIYSTCSYSQEENEDVVDWCMNNFQLKSLQIQLQKEWKITETTSPQRVAYGYRFWPYATQGEGFFIAAFLKQNSYEAMQITSAPSEKLKEFKSIKVNEYLNDEDKFIVTKNKEYLTALPRLWLNETRQLQQALQVRKSGITIGELKGIELIPNHELAASTDASLHIQRVHLNYDEALAYLRRQPITLENQKKGWCLCTFQNIALGWIKVLHNRVNNYYPTEWRILKN